MKSDEHTRIGSLAVSVDIAILVNNVGYARSSGRHAATELQVVACFRKLATVVDGQNASAPAYVPMTRNFDASEAFQTALGLALAAKRQSNGYTELILNKWRRRAKVRAE